MLKPCISIPVIDDASLRRALANQRAAVTAGLRIGT
jgi:hypothetical protein